MSARIIDGKRIAEEIKQDVQIQAQKLIDKGITPHLTAVQVGECSASKIYISRQQKLCNQLGIKYSLNEYAENISQNELLGEICKLNADSDVTGIILQLPVPEQIQASKIQAQIDMKKDVEGVNPANLGRLVLNDFDIVPCTPKAVMHVLESEGINLKGKNVVIVGHSDIVGKPLCLLLLGKFSTTSVCHIETINLKSHTVNADILISATGKAGLIDSTMIAPGAIVIDVGICKIPLLDTDGTPVLTKEGRTKTRITGDVDFESVKDVASAITPVPGGIGAVTSAILMQNIIKSAFLQF